MTEPVPASAPTPTPEEARPAFRQRVFRALFPGDGDSKTVDTLLIVLISANVLAVMAETTVPEEEQGTGFFFWFDIFSSVIFSAEYILRLWVCTEFERFKRPVMGRLRYAVTPMAIIGLVAILPFLMLAFEAFFTLNVDTRIARAIRMFRLVRILKMGRYAYAVRTLSDVFSRKKEELAIVAFVLVMLLILCSSAIYFVEPEKFQNIPAAMWWSVVTITSVGFGDVYPETDPGRVIGGIICMIGVLFVALPTGILSAGFLETMREQKRGKDSDVFGFCPHCGEQLLPGEELE